MFKIHKIVFRDRRLKAQRAYKTTFEVVEKSVQKN